MANIPIDRSTPQMNGASAGAYASDPQSFGSFTDVQANRIQDTLDDAATYLERQQAHVGAVAANDQATALQEDWIEKLPNYSDPEQFQKDYTQDQKTTADNLRKSNGGAAADFFLESTNHFAVRATRQVVRNQAKASKAGSIDALGNTLDNVGAISTWLGAPPAGATVSPEGNSSSGDPTLPPLPVQDTSTTNPNTAPLADPHGEIDKAVASAIGPVPAPVAIAMGNNAHQVVDRNFIQGTADDQGYEAAQAKLEDGTLGNYLDPKEKDSKLNDIILNNMGSRQVRGVGAKLALKNMTDSILSTGQIPTDDQQAALATAYADNLSDVKGKNKQALYLQAVQQIENAKTGTVIKSKLLGMNPDDQQNYVAGLQGNDAKVGKSLLTEFTRQRQTDPFTYSLNSPTLRNTFDAANAGLQANPNDPGAIKTFQDAIAQSMAIQKAGGVPDGQIAVMSKAHAVQMAQGFSSSDPDTLHKTLGNLITTYGDNASQAMANLTTLPPSGSRLDSKFQLLLGHYGDPIEQYMGQAFSEAKSGQTKKVLKLDDNPDTPKLWDSSIKATFAPFQDAMANSGSPLAGSQMRDGVLAYAQYLQAHNVTNNPADSVNTAYRDIIGSKYDTDSINGKGYVVPKTADNGTSYTSDEMSTIKLGMRAAISQLSGGASISGMSPSVGHYLGKDDKDVTDSDKAEFQNTLASRGYPIGTGKGTFRVGINMSGEPYTYTGSILSRLGFAQGNVPAAPAYKLLTDKEGKPLEIPYSSLLSVGKSSAGGLSSLSKGSYWDDASPVASPWDLSKTIK